MPLADYLVGLNQLSPEEILCLDAEIDTQATESGILKNSLGITDTKTLHAVENDLVALNLPDLTQLSPDGDIAHLQAIHRTLFKDIYPWAGQWRTVTFAKGDDFFLPAHRIPQALAQLFGSAQRDRFWQALAETAFHDAAADFFATLNYIHPFREGNGRTQREFLRSLYAQRGLRLSWDAVGDSAMIAAMQSARAGKMQTLSSLLALNSTPL